MFLPCNAVGLSMGTTVLIAVIMLHDCQCYVHHPHVAIGTMWCVIVAFLAMLTCFS